MSRHLSTLIAAAVIALGLAVGLPQLAGGQDAPPDTAPPPPPAVTCELPEHYGPTASALIPDARKVKQADDCLSTTDAVLAARIDDLTAALDAALVRVAAAEAASAASWPTECSEVERHNPDRVYLTAGDDGATDLRRSGWDDELHCKGKPPIALNVRHQHLADCDLDWRDPDTYTAGEWIIPAKWWQFLDGRSIEVTCHDHDHPGSPPDSPGLTWALHPDGRWLTLNWAGHHHPQHAE